MAAGISPESLVLNQHGASSVGRERGEKSAASGGRARVFGLTKFVGLVRANKAATHVKSPQTRPANNARLPLPLFSGDFRRCTDSPLCVTADRVVRTAVTPNDKQAKMKSNHVRAWARIVRCVSIPSALFVTSLASGQSTPDAAAPSAAPAPDADTVVLSPFEVSAGNDVGYYATHSLAGTRMNSELRDIPGSITVVTKAQLEDTAAVDINDVFLYEANTEGTHTYTEFALDRYGSADDRVQSSPSQANRVRGIGSAALSRDYFVGISGIPFDAYNVDRLTINRGPNSVLYGLGSPSGLVDSSPAQAIIDNNNTGLEFRVGSWGGRRASINLNRTLIPKRLAVRFAALYDDLGIRLQPAFETNRRQYGAISFRPFEKTHIHGYVEHYDNRAQRANAVTPADLISPWIANGRPMWNPTTLTATYQDGRRVTYAGTDFAATVAALPGVAPDEHLSRPYWVMDNGVPVGPRLQRRIGNNGPLNLDERLGLVDVPNYFPGVTRTNQPERLMFSHHPQFERNLAYPGYIAPGLTDRSLYDWTSLNLSAANHYASDAKIYQVVIEQQLTQNLHLELAAHRETLDAADENGINANQAKVYIDVNSHYLDGSVNPWAGLPFIESRQEVDAGQRPQELTVSRATLAYQLDFSRHDNFLRWFGRHNLMGLAQRSRTWDKFYRYRPGQTNYDSSWVDRTADGTLDQALSGTTPQFQSNRRYYLGHSGPAVQYSSGATPTAAYIPEPGAARGPDWPTTQLRHFRWTGRTADTTYPVAGGRPAGSWTNEDHTFAYLYQGGNSNQQIITSYSGALQSHLWDDRLVTTVGWRKDNLKSRTSRNLDSSGQPLPAVFDETTGHQPTDDLFGVRNPAVADLFPDPWDEISGTTTSRGIVARPFLKWERVPSWLREFGLHYNESDSFEPSAVNISLFGDILENPTGTGKDWGVSLPLFAGKLNAKLNFYDATAFNSRAGGDTGTVVTRVVRVENEADWGFVDFWEWNIELRDHLPLGSLDFYDLNDAETLPYVDEIYRLSGLPAGTLRGESRTQNDVRNITSKGLEFSIDYNPMPNFNIKFNVARQQSIETGGAPYTAEWIEQRWPHWTKAGATNSNFPMNPQVNWFTGRNLAGVRANQDPAYVPATGGTDIRWLANEIPSGWILGNVMAPFALLTELNGKPRPQVREWRYNVLATYRFSQGRLRGTAVGGSVRWEDAAAIGFEGDIDSTGRLVSDINRPVFDDANTNFDFWWSYSTRLFNDKLRFKVQINLRNAFEGGGLQPIRANPDGAFSTYRIVEPRTWSLTNTFDF